jgi:hypothetical protein
MYYKLTQREQEKIKKAQNYTITNYDLEGDFIPVDALMSCIEDLLVEIDCLQEKIEDLRELYNENNMEI